MSHWNSPMDEILTLLPRSVGGEVKIDHHKRPIPET